jgi:hypothetical protein
MEKAWYNKVKDLTLEEQWNELYLRKLQKPPFNFGEHISLFKQFPDLPNNDEYIYIWNIKEL